MATTDIAIVSPGDHGNVAPVYAPKSVSPGFPGGAGSTVPLQNQLKGDAFDAEDYSLLRLELQAAHPTNSRGFENDARLYVTLEHSPNGQQWEPLVTFEPMHAGAQRKTIGAFERYVRASWWIGRLGQPSLSFGEGIAFNWSLAGVGVGA